MNQIASPHIILLTGHPGVGKTTTLLRIEEYYRKKGIEVAGLITEEVRDGLRRVGFRIRDLRSREEGWLARTGSSGGPQVGKYTVDAHSLEIVGVKALRAAARGDAGLVLVDELGPMEMTSSAFRTAISELFGTEKTVVATVKDGSHYQEVEKALREGRAVTIRLTRENRDQLAEQIVSQLDDWMSLPGE